MELSVPTECYALEQPDNMRWLVKIRCEAVNMNSFLTMSGLYVVTLRNNDLAANLLAGVGGFQGPLCHYATVGGKMIPLSSWNLWAKTLEVKNQITLKSLNRAIMRLAPV